MKTGAALTRWTLGIYLLLVASGARAEAWVKAYPDTEIALSPKIDVDSIFKDEAGLLHYKQSDDAERALDCSKRIMYLIAKYIGKTYEWKNPDWRTRGNELIPGSDGARIADFVCAQGPSKKNIKNAGSGVAPNPDKRKRVNKRNGKNP
ncbi:MAG: hypothetical protein ABL955_05195 [Elusimicrobiota bacterium]